MQLSSREQRRLEKKSQQKKVIKFDRNRAYKNSHTISAMEAAILSVSGDRLSADSIVSTQIKLYFACLDLKEKHQPANIIYVNHAINNFLLLGMIKKNTAWQKLAKYALAELNESAVDTIRQFSWTTQLINIMAAEIGKMNGSMQVTADDHVSDCTILGHMYSIITINDEANGALSMFLNGTPMKEIYAQADTPQKKLREQMLDLAYSLYCIEYGKYGYGQFPADLKQVKDNAPLYQETIANLTQIGSEATKRAFAFKHTFNLALIDLDDLAKKIDDALMAQNGKEETMTKH